MRKFVPNSVNWDCDILAEIEAVFRLIKRIDAATNNGEMDGDAAGFAMLDAINSSKSWIVRIYLHVANFAKLNKMKKDVDFEHFIREYQREIWLEIDNSKFEFYTFAPEDVCLCARVYRMLKMHQSCQ